MISIICYLKRLADNFVIAILAFVWLLLVAILVICFNFRWHQVFLIVRPKQSYVYIPNGHNRRGFDVDITSIRRRPNFDKFPRHVRVLFRCNFDGRKIHVVSTLFTFIGVISMVEICTLFLLTFSDVILMGKDLTSFLVSC